MWIRTPNTGQLNSLFHTFAELRAIVNRVLARQSTHWLAANAQFSPNGVYVYSLSGSVLTVLVLQTEKRAFKLHRVEYPKNIQYKKCGYTNLHFSVKKEILF